MMYIEDIPDRFVAVSPEGKVFRTGSLALLWRILPVGTYIVKDEGRAQALYLRKVVPSPEAQSRPHLLWQPDEYLWLYLRRMAPGAYLVQEGPGQPVFQLDKLSAAWELILMRRHACWLKGEELSLETEQMLEGQLVALAAQLRATALSR